VLQEEAPGLERLILARHAETELNVRGVLNGDMQVEVRLTTRGREQARRLGRMAGPVDLVAHSEFARTRETAELAWPGCRRLVVPELNEIGFGNFEGTRWADGYGEWARRSGPLDACPGDGESRLEAAVRYLTGFRLLLDRPETTVALVGHGAPIRYLLLALEGSPPQPVLAGVPAARPFVVGREELEGAVDLIGQWAREPAWP